MDIQSLTLAGLVTLGVVNVLTMYAPQLGSKEKFIVSFIVAFGISFVPPAIGNIVLEKAKVAIEIAFASSGVYKLAQKAGGDGKY